MPDHLRILTCNLPGDLASPLGNALGDRSAVSAFDGDIRDLETCREQSACDVVVFAVPHNGDPLEILDVATRGIWNILTTTGARRFILLSTMRLFDRLDEGWGIDEQWEPRPTSDVPLLAPYLAECALREIGREIAIEGLVLRLDDVVDDAAWKRGDPAPTWLHVDDAVAALVAAIQAPALPRWSIRHVVRGDERGRYQRYVQGDWAFDWLPRHLDSRPRTEPFQPPSMPDRPGPIAGLAPPRRIVILGAAGPLAVATAMNAGDDIILRLADRRSLAEVASGPPQSPGAPLPDPIALARHEEMELDVTDPDSVRRALDGMDTVINCTVVRPDPVQAFRVNTLGAWNVMRGAADLGIRRVVQTGPVLSLAPYPIGRNEDRDIRTGSDRPGATLYFISKYLGQEIVRVFAEAYGIAAPSLSFIDFTSTDPDSARTHGHPCTLSWNDTGRAILAAARLQAMPRPFVPVTVLAPSPHDRYAADPAMDLLDWAPQDRIDHIWYREALHPAKPRDA